MHLASPAQIFSETQRPLPLTDSQVKSEPQRLQLALSKTQRLFVCLTQPSGQEPAVVISHLSIELHVCLVVNSRPKILKVVSFPKSQTPLLTFKTQRLRSGL